MCCFPPFISLSRSTTPAYAIQTQKDYDTEKHLCVFLSFFFFYKLALCPSLPGFCLWHSKGAIKCDVWVSKQANSHKNTHTHCSAHRHAAEESQKQANRNTYGSPTRLQSWKLACGVGWVGFMGLYLARGSYACILAHTQHTMCYVGIFFSVG